MAQILNWALQEDGSWQGTHGGAVVAVVSEITDLDNRDSIYKTHNWDVIGICWGQSNSRSNAFRAAEKHYRAEIENTGP